MRTSLFTATLVTGALLCAASATAGEIYKYTDADGNVHYGDRPTGNPTEERLAIVSRGTDPAAVQARIEARQARDATRQEARSAREEEAAAQADARSAAADRAAKTRTASAFISTTTHAKKPCGRFAIGSTNTAAREPRRTWAEAPLRFPARRLR